MHIGPPSYYSTKELDENELVHILNQHWSKASFGYPIHEDLRKPATVAEMLRTESMKQQNEIV